MTDQERSLFQETVWHYYAEHGRAMPWREPDAVGRFEPYRIMVSELMLQQTQVSRVIPKYEAFIERFPDIQTLAVAPLADVLVGWNGLGYNRRAKFLHQAAQALMRLPEGFPQTREALVQLPGIGPNTAGAILVYAFNRPLTFIETNIRTVYIHHFFQDDTEVADKQLEPFISETLDRASPREWYWALMDYGAFLKQTVGNRSRASKTYAKQSKFEGSLRQVRGAVLRALVAGPQPKAALQTLISDERLGDVLQVLEDEGLVRSRGDIYQLG